ncbi:MAG: hypothetical protein ACN6QY_10810 [Pseudomonas sp.]|uniref:WapI family immunity protein n=1 Tax=Pseudomonas sp. TaxID=306 RepID=UPI003D0FFC6D
MIDICDGDKRFSLKVCSYEFPFASDSDDANWLSVEVQVEDGDGVEWSAKEACLRTFELVELLDWFRSILVGRIKKEIYFTEGELGFSYVADKTLCVSFDFGFHPKGLNYEYGVDCEKLVSFSIDKKIICNIVEELEVLVSKFPIR